MLVYATKNLNAAHQALFSRSIVLYCIDWMLVDTLYTSENVPKSGILKVQAQYMHSRALKFTGIGIVQQCWHPRVSHKYYWSEQAQSLEGNLELVSSGAWVLSFSTKYCVPSAMI